MKPKNYGIRIIATVKAFRQLNACSQFATGSFLSTSESNYNKIEKGKKPISFDQVEEFANGIQTSTFLILFMAEFYEIASIPLLKWFEEVFKLPYLQNGKKMKTMLTQDEIDFLSERIKINIAEIES